MEIERYYDEIPYASHPYANTRPEHLQALGSMFGMTPADPAASRILEIGCASGGNVIPVAARFPNATVVGIDLSRVQIEKGQAIVAANGGLSNLTLHHGSIAEVDEAWGKFDYIICHGVFSWVPPDVQDAILRVARENLSDSGIAYISYNTYPGWKAREVIRDAMLLRSKNEPDPHRRLALAKGIVDFLNANVAENSLLKAAMKDGAGIVERHDPTYVAHEFLEPYNAPMYFQEFIEKAARNDLEYLGDAVHQVMFLQNYPDPIQQPLQAEVQGDHVLMEQYLDFVVGRTFRQSLLVHSRAGKDIIRGISHENLEKFAFFADLKDVAPPEGQTEVVEYQDDFGTRFNANNVAVRAVVQTLRERYPAMATYQELFDVMQSRTSFDETQTRQELNDALRILTVKASVGFSVPDTRIARSVNEKPFAIDYVRNAAANFVRQPGDGTSLSVTSLIHRETSVDFYVAWILSQLDGEKDLDALVREAEAAVAGNILRVTNAQGQPLHGEELRAHFRQTIPVALDQLRRSALLAG